MRRLLGMVFVLVMMSSMVGCKGNEEKAAVDTEAAVEASSEESSNTTTEAEVEQADEIYPAEKVLIGVEIYDPTESETIEIQKYYEYLAQNFNVEFKYSEAITNADQEMKFIEDCAIAGCKGFIARYNVSKEEQVKKVLEYDMYYYGGTTDFYETFKSEPEYLGFVSANGSDYEAGKALGQWVLDQGFDNVVYANGGADFGVAIFVDRQKGFMEAVGDQVAVTVVKGFPGDQFFADQAAALSTEGLDAVVASFNGVDFWAQPIASAGLENVKLATIGAINQAYLDAFMGNALSYLVAGNIQAYGFGVAMICNAVDGNSEAVEKDGLATLYAVPNFIVSSAEECEKIVEIQNNERIFTSEDWKEIIVKLNPSANAQTIIDLADSGTKENVLSR